MTPDEAKASGRAKVSDKVKVSGRAKASGDAGNAARATASGAVQFRPRRVRWVAVVCAVLVPVLFTVLSFGLQGSTGSGYGQFRTGDQLAMIGLGLLGGWGVSLFARPRVRADADGVQVRNVVGGCRLPWAVVRGIRFDRHSPWASLELHDDETVPVHALQAADKESAVAGVRALRALHATATAGPGAPPGP